MKKIRLATALIAALFICTFSASSRAYTGCLDIRDHGRHTFSARSEVTREEVQNEGMTGFGFSIIYGHYVYGYKYCVCGLRNDREVLLYQYKEEVSIFK